VSKLTKEEAQLRASGAALRSWANTPDRGARTAPARDARWQKYIEKARDLAPNPSDEADVVSRAEYLRQSDMKLMALKAAQARRKAKSTNARTADAANADRSNRAPDRALTSDLSGSGPEVGSAA
jgi:hypothetical protein